MRRVVITGIGTINSVGHNVEDSFKAVVNGECGIDIISLFDASEYPVQIAGEVKDFDPTTVMDKKEVKKADRFIQLGLKAANEAMMDSGYISQDQKKVDDSVSERFGMISASGIGGLSTIEKIQWRVKQEVLEKYLHFLFHLLWSICWGIYLY